ncbi:hypothetical protein K1719_020029 [Acacia pycnantha]|nr:hypothetical protein K1719_020029 [Acacia pycnantha]
MASASGDRMAGNSNNRVLEEKQQKWGNQNRKGMERLMRKRMKKNWDLHVDIQLWEKTATYLQLQTPKTLADFRIGYALADKKQQSFIQNSLVSLAESCGIDLVRVDADRPLVEQGPFDCVLHKLYGEDWKPQLRDFERKYPNTCEADEDKQTETFIFQARADDEMEESSGVEEET